MENAAEDIRLAAPERYHCSRQRPRRRLPRATPRGRAHKDEEYCRPNLRPGVARHEGFRTRAATSPVSRRSRTARRSLWPDCHGRRVVLPEGACAIRDPVTSLAHPRLKARNYRLIARSGMRAPPRMVPRLLLRHECGHAIDHADRSQPAPPGQAIFEQPRDEYTPETTRRAPNSRSFAATEPLVYAQAHPGPRTSPRLLQCGFLFPMTGAPALPRLEGSRKSGVRSSRCAGGRPHQARQFKRGRAHLRRPQTALSTDGTPLHPTRRKTLRR